MLKTPFHLSQHKSCKVLKVSQKALYDHLPSSPPTVTPVSPSLRSPGRLAAPLHANNFFLRATLSPNSHMICSFTFFQGLVQMSPYQGGLLDHPINMPTFSLPPHNTAFPTPPEFSYKLSQKMYIYFNN